MKRSLISAALMSLFLINSGSVLAQSAPLIKLSSPSDLQVNEDVTVTIQLEETDGSPFSTGVLPDITFSPADSIEDDVLYDCEIEDADNCGSNNRGAVGIFEALFRVTAFPVTVSVELNGVTETLELQGSTEVTTTTPEPAANSPEVSNTAAAETIQVGPSPSWALMILIAILGAASTYGVLTSQREQ